MCFVFFFFFSSRRRHTRCSRDWSSDVCSSDLRLRTKVTGNNTLGRTVYRIYLALGSVIPPALRSRYILDVYERAIAAYTPAIYPGRLVLVRTSRSEERRVGKECRYRCTSDRLM